MLTAYCHICGRDTGTAYHQLSSGHIGNLCSLCRTARKGRPYISKAEYFAITTPTPTPGRVKGQTYVSVQKI